MSALSEIGKLKVTELRSELQTRGLDTKGVKAVLLDRLREAIEAEENAEDPETVHEKEKDKVAEKAKEDDAVEAKEDDDAAEEEEDDDAEEAKEDDDAAAAEEEEKADEVTEEEKVDEVAEEEKADEVAEEEKADEVAEEEEVAEKEKAEEVAEKEKADEVAEEEKADEVAEEEKTEEVAEEAMETDKVVEENGHEDLSVKEEKTDCEDAPMEDLSAVKVETKEDDSVKKEAETATEVKMEVSAEVKTENSSPEKRGIKRSNENSHSHSDSKRAKPDQVDEIRVEDEPDFDKSSVTLDWYNSDLSLVIDKEKGLSASPIVIGGFVYVWHGVRALYGCKSGKLFYEVKVEDHLEITVEDDEMHPYVLRVGWSVDSTQLTLGEENLSYGYGGTGKASSNLIFKNYGKKYAKGDVIGCFLDMDAKPMTMSFTVNGEHQGVCYEINGEDLGDKAIFPHILTKNCSFKVNFGSEDAWFEPLTGYTFIGKIPVDDLTMGTQGPDKREDAEIIMLVGLPAAGKSTWAEKYCGENPEKKYNVLGTNNLIDRMKVMGLPRKRNYGGRWDQLIDKCTKCLNKLLYIATKRRRNFILDQTNVYPSAQKRKIKGFAGYKRRAVVVVPTDDELKSRTKKREGEEGKDVPDKAILEMKGNFRLPEVGEFFDQVDLVELEQEDATELVKKYNKEGEDAGFGPKKFSTNYQQGRRVGYVDRQGKYNNNNRGGGGYGAGQQQRGGGGYRGGWDRDRDRRGTFDRREHSGGWNKDRSYHGASGGGYNKDRRGGSSWNSSSGGGGYKGSQGKSDSWGQGNQGYSQSYNSGGGQSYTGSNQGGYNANSGGNTGYNWNQQYYGNQQGQQQQPQSYNNSSYSSSGNQYGSSSGYGGNAYSSSYGNTQQQYQQPQQQQQTQTTTQQPQQQWGGYSQQQSYGSSGSYNQSQYRK